MGLRYHRLERLEDDVRGARRVADREAKVFAEDDIRRTRRVTSRQAEGF